MQLECVVVEDPDFEEILTTPSQEIEFPLDEKMQALAKALKVKVVQLQGVGLAACQVNIPVKMCVVCIQEGAVKLRLNATTFGPKIFINPSYQPTDDAVKTEDWEGCFSVRDTTGKVPRYDKIIYQYQDEQGQSHTDVASGFLARVIQHEFDHLEGKLILHRFESDGVYGSVAQMLHKRLEELSLEQLLAYREILEKQNNGTQSVNLDFIDNIIQDKKDKGLS